MPTTIQSKNAVGKDVFNAAVTAAVDDFTAVRESHLHAAVGFAESQSFLTKRDSRVLRHLRREIRRRRRPSKLRLR